MISTRGSIQKKIFSNDEKIQKINLVKLDFPINELLEKRESQSAIERSLVDLKHVYENQKKELERLEASISKLNEVPCGDSFPTCKFIKDSHEDKDRILNQRDETKKSLKSLKSAKSALSSILRESIDEKIEKYDSLVTKESEISLDTSSLQIDLNNCENLLSSSEADLLKLKDELLDMIPRLVESEENPSAVIRASIVSLEDDIKKLDRKRLRKFENIISLNAEISRMKSDRKEFDTIKQDLIAYDFFMQATSKKGIPLQIMMSQLPLINSEISKILQGVTGFTVDLEADPESNSMDIYINYGDSRRIIELASGMEKMMASLAIRVALINVSSLTKTNMLIIDEGFGALDETNIEACSRLLESLKKWFRNIIVISHVDAIKDAVDNSLEITKNEKDTKVYSA
jgi:exonuclease SbcC